MTIRPDTTTRRGRDGPVESPALCDDRAVLQALKAACHLHEGPETVTELVWAWAADPWWNAVADPNPAVDAMTIPHTPSRADLARVRRRLTALHRQGLVVRTGHPARWQPLESSDRLFLVLPRDAFGATSTNALAEECSGAIALVP